jgi:hypothetical protein
MPLRALGNYVTTASSRFSYKGRIIAIRPFVFPDDVWWAHQDSNLGQAGYEPAALTAEL